MVTTPRGAKPLVPSGPRGCLMTPSMLAILLPNRGLAPGLRPASGLVSCALRRRCTQGEEGELLADPSPPESPPLRRISGLLRGASELLSSVARGERPGKLRRRMFGLLRGLPRGLTLGDDLADEVALRWPPV